MYLRPEWLEKYRVHNVNRNKRGRKAVYIDRDSNLVQATHFNLIGGTYCVPRHLENDFLRSYIDFVFDKRQGRLALTENPISTVMGTSFSPVCIHLNLRYPVNAEGT